MSDSEDNKHEHIFAYDDSTNSFDMVKLGTRRSRAKEKEEEAVLCIIKVLSKHSPCPIYILN